MRSSFRSSGVVCSVRLCLVARCVLFVVVDINSSVSLFVCFGCPGGLGWFVYSMWEPHAGHRPSAVPVLS